MKSLFGSNYSTALAIGSTRAGVYPSIKPRVLFVSGILHGSNVFVVLTTGVGKWRMS